MSWQSLWGDEGQLDTEGEAVEGISALPLICATGDYGLGKTLFGYRIIARKKGDGPPPVIAFDFEGSGLSYAKSFNIDHVDMRGLRPLEIYEKFTTIVTQMQKGQFAVAIIDTVEPLDDAFKAWVLANPSAFGHTAQQYNGGSGGLYWGDVKLHMRRWISALTSKVQTTVAVAHLRQSYNGSTPIKGKFEPKGLDIWEQFAALYAWLVPGPKGKGVGAPSAVLLKRRAVFADWDDVDEMGVPSLKPLFPRFVANFDASALRDYMVNPRKEFKAAELKDIDPSFIAFNQDERLSMQATVAEAAILTAQQQKEVDTNNGKKKFAEELKGKYGYSADEAELRKEIVTTFAELNLTYSVAEHDAIRNAFIKHRGAVPVEE